MSLNLPRPVKAVISIVIDTGINMGRRIEAAELLIQHNLPDPVVSAARKFLCEIAEDKTGFPGHRLAAARAVLKRDVGKFKRPQPAKPLRYDPLRGMRDVTAAELIARGLAATAERDARLERDRQLRLVSALPDPPADIEPKAG
jgi:hypothetical protein